MKNIVGMIMPGDELGAERGTEQALVLGREGRLHLALPTEHLDQRVAR